MICYPAGSRISIGSKISNMRRAKLGGHMACLDMFPTHRATAGCPGIRAGSDLKDIECSGLPAIFVLQEGAGLTHDSS